MTSSEACQGRSTSLGMPLSGEGAADDHPDGVVPGVGDVDIPPGVDGDGQGVVQEGRSCRSSVSGVTNRSGSGEVVDTIARTQHPDTVEIAFVEEKIREIIVEFIEQ